MADWNAVNSRTGLAGYTCPECPKYTEPIRRMVSKAGTVRFRVVMDSTPRGAGKRTQVTRTLDTLASARAFVAETREEVARTGTLRRESVEALCTHWLATHRRARQVTREGYEYALQPVIRRIGTRIAREVTVSEIRELVGWLEHHGGKPSKAHPEGTPLGPRSVRLALTALAMAFDTLDTAENPVRHRTVQLPPMPTKVGQDLQHWNAADLLRFRDHADTDELAGAWRLTLAGLTRADVMGLRWSDVDLEAGTATVRQGRVVVHTGESRDHVGTPKTLQRRRMVPVEAAHPGTVALLRALKARQAEHRLRAGAAWHDSGFVVVNELGQPLRPEVYSDRFKRLCKAARVPVIRLHSVRHSLAFWLHSLGVTPADAAALLGHTVQVHLSTYLPESGASGIARATDALGRAMRTKVAAGS
ncbi:MAG: site-specific integrase [bacterium]|nr:site-specific integrase [bacterium]